MKYALSYIKEVAVTTVGMMGCVREDFTKEVIPEQVFKVNGNWTSEQDREEYSREQGAECAKAIVFENYRLFVISAE